MALKLNEVEQEQECGEADDNIELTDDDKSYIEKLMVERYTFRTTKHRDKFKCILPCHICDKIELSKNPESTSTFLDFIFMEHENDFEFTKEKRQKIIQSLVNEFIEEETKIEDNLRNVKIPRNKIKHSSRKSLIVQRAQRYSAIPLRIRNKIRILPERRKKVSRIPKRKEMSEFSKLKKTIKTSITHKLRSHSKTTFPNAECHVPTLTPENMRHTVVSNLKPNQTGCQTVVEIKVRPTSVIKKVKSRGTESTSEFKQRLLRIKQADVVEKRFNSKEIFKNNIEPKYEVKPSSIIRRVNPEGNKENESLSMVRPNVKIPIKKRLNYNFEGIKKERKVPMKDPEDPFYIPEDYMDVALYQNGLACQGWNPTQVLYEICGYCGWGKPEFLEGGDVWGGFMCCVRVKGFGFMSRVRGQTKKIARHLASTRFLNQIGFKFNFNIFSYVPLRSINSNGEERFVPPGRFNAWTKNQF